MRIVKIESAVPKLGGLVADFRVTLRAFKGIVSRPDAASGTEELQEYLDAGFPVYAAMDGEIPVGYMVCKIEEPCVWVEQIYVIPERRGGDAAEKLLEEAEQIAKGFGEDTLYFYVHPNNDRMISFLRKNGYTVLNLLEVRKPYRNEEPAQQIEGGKKKFDY